MLAMAPSHGEVTSPQTINLCLHATFTSYYVDVGAKANGDLLTLNEAYEPLEHAVVKTKFMKLQEGRRRVDVDSPSFLIDVVK